MKIIHNFILIIIFLFVNNFRSLPQVSDSLQYIGHASMKIKTSDGKIIYIDPYHTPGDYSDSADIVLVTHSHSDHNNVGLVNQKLTCTVITYAEANLSGILQSFNVDNIKINAVAAYNQNHNRNNCVGYVLEFNGIKLYHAGDTGKIPEMEDLADSNITYALIPVDSIFTMSPQEATEAAEMIRADFSIPMHTEPAPDDYNEDKVSRFTPANRLLVRNGETIALLNPSADVKNKFVDLLEFKLDQSYPNPFNPSTTINFTIPNASFVTLKIFDINGREAATILKKEMPAGNHSIKWNAGNLSSGVYFYRLDAGNFTATKKLLLLK